MSDDPIDQVPGTVLARWQRWRGAPVQRIGGGLINDSFAVGHGPEAVLQRLHPVFAAEVNLDVEAVTRRLAGCGLRTPLLLPADDGALWVDHEGRVWRALSFVAGRSHEKLGSPSMAREAGAACARFHAALQGFTYRYRFARAGVHDTAAHVRRLREALATCASHPLHGQVAPAADPLLAAADGLADFARLPQRHCHGDLKVSNILFDDAGAAVCLIDLDTVAPMAWPLEMGDALRSWCNPRAEDSASAALDLELLDAALAGYAAGARVPLTTAEVDALVPGLVAICLELSARFLCDALCETYFAWDPARYATRGEHNLARGRAMAALHADVLRQQAAARDRVRRHLG